MKLKLLCLLLLCFSLIKFSYSQKTRPVLAPGVTAPIGTNNNNSVPFGLASCDYNDVRVFPSQNPQSEKIGRAHV